MEKQDVIRIAEGLRLIEEGVETIQAVMKEKKIKSLKDVAAELIPFSKRMTIHSPNPSSATWNKAISQRWWPAPALRGKGRTPIYGIRPLNGSNHPQTI